MASGKRQKIDNMATMELPPRRSRKISEFTIQRNRSSLDTLMQMGFPRHRAEKALAATGDKGVQFASDWLLSHVGDNTLDEKTPRDYILYLCPVGSLQKELLELWHKTHRECGWNGAHSSFPHITVCSFFKAEDKLVSHLSHILKTVAEKHQKSMPDVLELDYFSSTNFIGLFVSESCAPLLKQITADFAEEAKKSGVTVEPHKKQLHVSLAYQFPTHQKDKLEALVKSANMHASVRWDLRLYSRDPRIAKCQVHKVMYKHNPRAPDELEMVEGDFIFMDESELENNPDQWYTGTSWLSGCTGLFPGTYTERAAETETWTMHRSIPIIGTDKGTKAEENGPSSNLRDDSLYAKNTPFDAQVDKSAKTTATAKTVAACSPKPARRTTKASPDTSQTGMERRVIKVSQDTGQAAMDRRTVKTNMDSTVPVPERRTPQEGIRPVKSQAPQPPGENPTSRQTGQEAGRASKPQTDVGQTQSKISHSQNTQTTLSLNRGKTQNTQTTLSLAEVRNNPNKGSDGHPAPKSAKRNINATSMTNRGPRQLYVVRHGERIDFTFGKDWIKNSFDPAGNYLRYDLNMPKSLPKRKGGPPDFSKDSPLTVQGHFQARLIGEALKEREIPISHVYSSPSLRCVETASSMLEGLGIQRDIGLEPGLFEWLGWYQSGVPKFMTPQEMKDCGFQINVSYTPAWPLAKYNVQETIEQYYDRCYHVTREILKKHENEGGNVLLMAHAASLDVCTRQLVGHTARSQFGFHDVLHKIPYCAVSVAQEACHVRDTWYLVEPPILPFAHTNNPKYNWTCLTSPSSV